MSAPDPTNIPVDTSPQTYGPDMFFSEMENPDPTLQVNEPLPRAWSQGGIIESVKRAVVTGMREAFEMSGVDNTPGKFQIDIEYPFDVQNLPAVWVQFSIDNLQRAGMNMGEWIKDDDGTWGEIRTWIFNGKITLTTAALTAKDRDRLADTIIAQLAFSRAPDLVIRDSNRDAQQFRGLISALNENPYVSMTLNTDQILSGGQGVTNTIPWESNQLLYEDNYTVACHGQFNMRYRFDGVYELAKINLNPSLMAEGQAYNPVQWRGRPSPR